MSTEQSAMVTRQLGKANPKTQTNPQTTPPFQNKNQLLRWPSILLAERQTSCFHEAHIQTQIQSRQSLKYPA